MKKILEGAATLLVALFILVCLWFSVKGTGSGRYRIVVGRGDYTDTYRTNAFTKQGNCVRFKVWEDSMTVCGSYRIYAY